MTQTCFIGIDQGSSSTKAVVISEKGQMLFQTKQALPPAFRDGDIVQYDASDIENSVRGVLQEAVDAVQASGFPPAAIGLACQRSSCLAWDEKTGRPLSPVISWRDTGERDFIKKLSPEADRIFQTTGLPLTPYYSACKLRRLRESLSVNDHAVFGTLSSFLTQRLTGSAHAVIDHTHAARTQLMKIHTLSWDRDLAALFGLTGVRLPEIVPVIHDYGTVQTAAGPVPLRVSIGDQQAAMIGLGVLEESDGGINFGTGGFLMIHTGSRLLPARGLMSSVLYSTPDTANYLLEGSVNAAGDALEWVRSHLHLFTDYTELDDLCWQAATDVVAFLGLNGTGAPHWESAISSSLHGLVRESTSADIVRASVECIAFFVKDIAGQMESAGRIPKELTVSGGLASLSYLVQLQADILQKELRVSEQQEVTALGSALLAGMAQGTWATPDARKMVAGGEITEPRHNAGAEKRYRRWKELHRITKELDKTE